MIGALFPVVNRNRVPQSNLFPRAIADLHNRIEAIQAFVDGFATQKAAANAIGASASQLSKVLNPDSATSGRVESVEGKIARWKLAQSKGDQGKIAGADPATNAPDGLLTTRRPHVVLDDSGPRGPSESRVPLEEIYDDDGRHVGTRYVVTVMFETPYASTLQRSGREVPREVSREAA